MWSHTVPAALLDMAQAFLKTSLTPQCSPGEFLVAKAVLKTSTTEHHVEVDNARLHISIYMLGTGHDSSPVARARAFDRCGVPFSKKGAFQGFTRWDEIEGFSSHARPSLTLFPKAPRVVCACLWLDRTASALKGKPSSARTRSDTPVQKTSR